MVMARRGKNRVVMLLKKAMIWSADGGDPVFAGPAARHTVRATQTKTALACSAAGNAAEQSRF